MANNAIPAGVDEDLDTPDYIVTVSAVARW